MPFPPRPDQGGRNGRAVQVQVNMFQITALPQCNLFSYDVTIREKGVAVPAPPAIGQRGVVLKNPTKPGINRRILRKLVAAYSASHFRNIPFAYDGRSNLFTSRRLEKEEYNLEVEVEQDEGITGSRMREFFVDIQFTKVIEMARLQQYFQNPRGDVPQDCLTAMEVIFAHLPSNRFTPRMRSFFTNAESRSLGGGAEVWSGYFQSIRPSKSGLLMNIDVSATAFSEPRPVLDIACDLWRQSPESLARTQYQPRDSERKMLERVLHLLQVETNYRAEYRRRTRVTGVSAKSATQMKFDMDGTTVTVADYFQTQYNYRLRYPLLPCLKVGTKGSYLPLEVCTVVPGQRFARKLDESQTAEMIRFTCQRPNERAKRIENGIPALQVNETPQLRDMGIQVEPRMKVVQARILEPPQVRYDSQPFVPRDGAWNMRDRGFKAGGSLEAWGVIIVGSERNMPLGRVQDFIGQLCHMAQKMHMRVVHNRPPILRCQNDRDLYPVIKELEQQVGRETGKKINFLMAIVGGDSETYSMQKRKPVVPVIVRNLCVGQIKCITDLQVGIPSQCIKAKNICGPRGANPQYTGNVLLKMNMKLGGRNCEIASDLPLMNQKTMVFGADVTHPSPVASGRDSMTPSIVALVGSIDRWVTSYRSVVRLQPPRCEEIQSLKEMVKELMMQFATAANGLPQRLVFFRDGVSEGQFMTVFNYEVNAIKNACMELVPDGSYSPPITFIVIQKRHHTRMFAAQGCPTDRSGNVPPGTVVDQAIVHPHDFDFYLMSHAGIQGTSRPAHYYVLMDENQFTSDSLQQFCYYLCHLFSRCTRSVSIVPPVYYAHLLAYRARFHATGNLWGGSETASQVSGRTGRTGGSGGQRGEGQFDEEALDKGLRKIHQGLSAYRPMFFV